MDAVELINAVAELVLCDQCVFAGVVGEWCEVQAECAVAVLLDWDVFDDELIEDAGIGHEARVEDGAEKRRFGDRVEGEADAAAIGSGEVDARALAEWVRAEHASPRLLGGRDADRFADAWGVEAEAPAEAEVAADVGFQSVVDAVDLDRDAGQWNLQVGELEAEVAELGLRFDGELDR